MENSYNKKVENPAKLFSTSPVSDLKISIYISEIKFPLFIFCSPSKFF